MTFKHLSEYFQQLEKTTLRNKMVEILASLFKEANPAEIGKLCYLLQGRVAALYTAVEFGVADKMMIRAISQGLEIDQKDVVTEFKKEGDLGTTAEKLRVRNKRKGTRNTITISEVFTDLYKVASSTGDGSQEQKVTILAGLIRSVDPLSVRYVVRITLGKLRLGFSDMTMLDGFSWMEKGDKSGKETIEKAYNVRPDLAYIGETIKKYGIKGLHGVPKPGIPILMARANRLSSAEDILLKIGRCAVEYKYDGLRLQVHKDGKMLKMFSRNLEDVTSSFPDIAKAVRVQVHVDSIIFEGEVVAYNPKNGVFVPFQETMQRKRKYDIEKKALEIPVKLFVFELLFCNGKSFLGSPYFERKKKLKEVIQKGNTIVYAQEHIVSKEAQIDEIFDDSVEKNFEGIIAKKLEGLYEAGVRGWNWIKYKKAMNKKLTDTVDVLVMGYTKGEGKRTSFGVGQFLGGLYDEKRDMFVTVSKIGTGLTDEQFRDFFTRVKKLHAKEKPPLYDVDKLLEPDVWLEPSLVVEIACDEITRSAVHTAGRVMKPSKSGKAFAVDIPGYALRFPRLVRFRDDRRPQDATTVKEVMKMYGAQGKK
ncbi:ATP-dependent DNA ligase [Candidatus Gottesmanbacteria bacterium]|nr:ATP-dependent DNA ligase [Candidatus Gottesmanbacteria bacterium]